MNRRQYLALCGVSASGPLAGCTAFWEGSGDGTAPDRTTVDGPAQFDDVVVQVPGNATIGEEATVRVSVYNYGSEAGTFEDTLRLVEGGGSASKRVEIPEIPPGERKHVDLRLSFGGVGRYRLRLENAGVFVTTEVTAEEASPGEALELGEFRVTAESVRFESGLFYEYAADGRGRELIDPDPGNLLAVVRATVENRAGGDRTFDPSSLSVTDGALHADSVDELRGVTSVRGTSLAGTTVGTDESLDGWLVADVDADTARSDGLTLGWQADEADTPFEKRWTFPAPDALAEFAVESFEVPRRTTAGRVEATATIRNEGDASGTFRGSIDRRADGSGWTSVALPEFTLSPGDSRQVAVTTTWPYVDWTEWRIRPFHEKRETDYDPLTVPFGQRVPTAEASTLVVRNPRIVDSYVYETTVEVPVSDPFGNTTETSATRVEERTRTPSDPGEGAFLFVDVEAVAGRADGRVPEEGRFVAAVDGREYDTDHAHRPIRPRATYFDSPGEGSRQGEAFRGTLVFGVPAGTTQGDVSVRYRESYRKRTVAATWE